MDNNTLIYWGANILIGILAGIINKKKGYSPITGFLWGFFFSLLGLAVVYMGRPREEREAAQEGKLKMWQWLLIFLGIGILLIILFITILSLL